MPVLSSCLMIANRIRYTFYEVFSCHQTKKQNEKVNSLEVAVSSADRTNVTPSSDLDGRRTSCKHKPNNVFLWCYLCFVLLRFRLYAFVEAAALRSIVLRYAGASIATCVSFSFFFFIWRCCIFRVFFVPLPFSLCMESTSYVLSFMMVFFYLVTTGWIFDTANNVRFLLNKKTRKHDPTSWNQLQAHLL